MWYAASTSVELPQASVARSFAVPEQRVSKSIASSVVTLTSGDRYPEERQDTIIFGAGDVVAADRVVERIHRYFAYIRELCLKVGQHLVRRRPELIAQSRGF